MADEEQNTQNLKEEDENILLWATLELVSELIFLSQELKEKLHYLETPESQRQQSLIFSEMILPQVEESSGNFEIPLSEELYRQLCTHLGSDRIEFMGIA